MDVDAKRIFISVVTLLVGSAVLQLSRPHSVLEPLLEWMDEINCRTVGKATTPRLIFAAVPLQDFFRRKRDNLKIPPERGIPNRANTRVLQISEGSDELRNPIRGCRT